MFSPDGRRIVFVCFTPGAAGEGLCTMVRDGSDVRPLVDGDEDLEDHPTWGVGTS